MNSLFDVQQLLKKYGTIIYTGDRLADLDLMGDELKELYQARLLETKDYQTAVLILRKRIAEEQAKLNA
ncbi:YqgQ family protein [Priestia taiwanensis]|uniref:DUF910 domain-containing protein n=1 Tax=Priestia taiwanensis TaxID=1347902 RepID=A0A917AVR4_9BACI|nr:YqgQ family protein [Priestia taiwanensis]MBM7363801.1 uncharacterized protein YqgQ [Priestia taiwanensis]GGE74007.1 hypothetical protein GCM10007140_24850 [Priestia taiwanensis]